MSLVEASYHHGIVIRRAALRERGVSLEQIEAAMQDYPMGQNRELLSFGPHDDGASATAMAGRLGELGLQPRADFFIFHGDFPPWCHFRAELVPD